MLRHFFSSLRFSATNLEIAICIPPEHTAMPSISTGVTNWKMPRPFAPIAFDKNILYKKPRSLHIMPEAVRRKAPVTTGRFFSEMILEKKVLLSVKAGIPADFIFDMITPLVLLINNMKARNKI